MKMQYSLLNFLHATFHYSPFFVQVNCINKMAVHLPTTFLHSLTAILGSSPSVFFLHLFHNRTLGMSGTSFLANVNSHVSHMLLPVCLSVVCNARAPYSGG